jgi:hypothetical protein
MRARGETLWQAFLHPDQNRVDTLLGAVSVEDAILQARGDRPLAALLKLRNAIDALNFDLCRTLSREVSVSVFFNDDLDDLIQGSNPRARHRLLESVNLSAGRAAERAAAEAERAAAQARASEAEAERAAAEVRASEAEAERAAADTERAAAEAERAAAERAAAEAERAAAQARANEAEAERAAADTERAAAEAERAAAQARANEAEAERAAAVAQAARFVADQVWTRGLPQLVMGGGYGTPSGSSHTAVQSRLGVLNEIAGDIAWHRDSVSAVYLELNGREALSYSNESAVALFVRAVLRDIMNGHPNLRGVVSIDTEVTVASLRPDIMVLSINSLPIGFCEVKKPGIMYNVDTALHRPEILGQAYDYAMELRHLHGLQWAFVILTTFTHWRVLWLDDDAGNYGAQLAALDDESVAAPRSTVATPPPVCTDIVEGVNRPQLASFLASVLLKMAKSPRSASKSVIRPYLQEQGIRWWVYDEPPNSVYSFPDDPNPPFARLEQLFSGRDGSCWVVAKEGQMYVLKIVRRAAATSYQDALDAAELEARRWDSIWGVPSQAVIVLGCPALVMPYVEIFPNAESYLRRVEDVELAVLQMAQRGFVHGDLFEHDGSVKYWHFGLRRERVVAIDLRVMSEMDPSEATATVQAQIDSRRFRNAVEMHLRIHVPRR